VIFIGVLLVSGSLLKYRLSHYGFLLLLWVSFFLSIAFQGIAYLFLDKTWFRAGILAMIPAAFIIGHLIDRITRLTFDPYKLLLTVILSVLVLMNTLRPDSVEDMAFPNGDPSLSMGSTLRIYQSVLSLGVSFFWIYYTVKIYQNASPSQRNLARVNIIGAVFLSVVSVALMVTGMTTLIPGIHYLSIAIGVLISTIALVREEKLVFILPFKVSRLIVLDLTFGVPIYSHSWDDTKLLQGLDLFHSLMGGMEELLDIFVKKGNIKEIWLNSGILLLEKVPEKNLVLILESTRPSTILREALEKFHAMLVSADGQAEKGRESLQNRAFLQHVKDRCFAFVSHQTTF